MSALGTEIKINVHVEPIDGFHMADYDFKCQFYVYTNRFILLNKADMKEIDKDNYLAIITSDSALKIGRGVVKLKFTAYIPDADFPDGLRTEIAEVVCKDAVIT